MTLGAWTLLYNIWVPHIGIEHLFTLEGRVALVTGAGRGIGQTLARGLASAGASIAAAARTAAEVEQLSVALNDLGTSASHHVVDVQNIDSIERLVQDVLSVHGRIDILVNNAGAKVNQSAEDVTEGAWDRVIDTNLKGAFFVAQAVGRHMLGRGSGKVINVASTYAVVAAPNRTTYAISKGGLLQMTRSLAVEWAGRGVNVNAIGPTSIETPMNADLFADPEWRASALGKIPAGRFAAPGDLVGPVVFLASTASDMVHGHLLLVDGGWTAA